MSWLNGLGFHSMWGFSPAKDLLRYRRDEDGTRREGEETGPIQAEEGEDLHLDHPYNVLLLQPCDPRSIIRTIAERSLLHSKPSPNSEGCSTGDGGDSGQRRRRPVVHFYVLGRPIEVLARQLLLLHVFLDASVPLRQRAALYLEIFGNALVRAKTERYVEEVGRSLVELVYDGDGNGDGGNYEGPLASIVDLNHMKQRERDDLAAVFESWGRSVEYDVRELRDHRLRGYYGERYDRREAVLDWDYHSRVRDVASIIHTKQYREFRQTGIAFEYGDATYDAPNRSCSSHAEGTMKSGKDRGQKKDVRGYWLDVVVGPYVAFGVECSDDGMGDDEYGRDLFHVVNEGTGSAQHRHHTVEVATYNMLGYMWNVETGTPYRMSKKGDIFSGLGKGEDAEASTEKEKVPEQADAQNGVTTAASTDGSDGPPNDDAPYDAASVASRIAAALADVKIIPLGASRNVAALASKRKYRGLFRHVSVSQQASDALLLKADEGGDGDCLNELLADEAVGATVEVETAKFVFPLSGKDKRQQVENSLRVACVGHGWVEETESRDEEKDVLLFRRKK